MHTADILTLLPFEQDRLLQIERFLSGDITQVVAARILGLSTRHFRRLVRRYKALGNAGVKHQRLGKKASNRISDEIKAEALGLIREHFFDYGPTLAAEKLQAYFGIKISKETARQWMIETELWVAHAVKPVRAHPPRARRSYLGELVQIDGSYHDWFEGRGPKCSLLVFIDDATSKLMKLQFAPAETTIDYLSALKDYVSEHGVPRALYSDKHNVFRVNQKTVNTPDGVTQFGRVLKKLGIKPAFANTPQAKGRVERVNATLQDRLVKELRFHQINDIAQANLFLEDYIQRHNQRFAKQPQEPDNMHRLLSPQEQQSLDDLFSIHTKRKISRNLIVRYNKQLLKIVWPNRGHRLVNQEVLICEDLTGIRLFLNGKKLDYVTDALQPLAGPVINRKVLDQYMDKQLQYENYWRLASLP